MAYQMIIQKAIDLFRGVTDLSKKVLEESDPEKYARSVTELSQGVSSTYDHMRKIITESDKFDEDEKLRRLSKLAEQEMETKKKCDEAIKGHREHVAKVAFEIVKGLLTCGITFVPAMVKELKSAVGDKKSAAEVETLLLKSDGTSVD